ncbi:hypothetical protein GW7_09994 [Heterocephalus glaber]|uniref:Uncharacterized protein n=1 Tax=Heterocephalus glaber TaxID=10181 RepID=G5BSE3_HETGA|nr:hypothetical protein GW7_09994 [Heterocephalus glaber]
MEDRSSAPAASVCSASSSEPKRSRTWAIATAAGPAPPEPETLHNCSRHAAVLPPLPGPVLPNPFQPDSEALVGPSSGTWPVRAQDAVRLSCSGPPPLCSCPSLPSPRCPALDDLEASSRPLLPSPPEASLTTPRSAGSGPTRQTLIFYLRFSFQAQTC